MKAWRGRSRPGVSSARSTPRLGLALIGIDNIRALEDLFGEAVGEAIIREVAARARPLLPRGARLWQAEHRRLAIAMPAADHPTLSALVAALQASIAQSEIETPEGPVAVTVAAGCSLCTEGEHDAAFAAARAALAEAMRRGVGCISFAEEGTGTLERRQRIVAAARAALGALRRGRLTIAYQPVVAAESTGRAAFHECLVRIQEPDGSLIAAGEFIPAMEQLGLAPLVDRHVVSLALRALAENPSLRLSINIYPQTMQDAQWMMLFDEATRSDPEIPERLIIEVTETAAMLDPARTLDFMDRLRRRGVAFALDDFGMGHTSFGTLRDFRFDLIKIDGSFITDVTTNPDSRFFVEKLVDIARHFDMLTVAEFVQDAPSARILRDLGVQYFQGFYFGRPSLVLDATPTPEPIIAEAR